MIRPGALPLVDANEDEWLARLTAHLDDHDHTLKLTGGLRADDEDDPALVRASDGRWWAGRFIGELRFEDRELRIEPRLGIEVVGAWLAHALNLRGRLDVPATVAHRVARRPFVASTRVERDLDNAVSRVLVLADGTLRSLVGERPAWRPALTGEILGQLRGAVGSVPKLPEPEELHRIRYTPITRRFEPVARLSREIAHRRGTLTAASGSDAAGVLIDVAELWDLFLVHCARKAFGPARVEHGTAERSGAHVLHSLADGDGRLGRLKPDILISDPGGRLAAVVDAKYKRLRSTRERPSGVDRGDLYQLTSYLSGHDVRLGVLAYPPAENDDAIADTRGPWATRLGQEVRFARFQSRADDCVQDFPTFFGRQRPRGNHDRASARDLEHGALPRSLLGVGVVLGEDLKRLWMLGDHALAYAADPLAQLVGRDDPQLAAGELFDEHRSAGRVALRLELTRNRHDVAVPDATNLDDLHARADIQGSCS